MKTLLLTMMLVSTIACQKKVQEPVTVSAPTTAPTVEVNTTTVDDSVTAPAETETIDKVECED